MNRRFRGEQQILTTDPESVNKRLSIKHVDIYRCTTIDLRIRPIEELADLTRWNKRFGFREIREEANRNRNPIKTGDR